MSSIKTLIRENINDIINDLNEELLSDRILRFWDKVNIMERDSKPYGYTLDELMCTYWVGKKARSEFAVDLGVTFGKITELYLPFKLKSLGCNVVPIFTSEGDMKELEKFWEIKTGRGKFIQGATHSPKEKKPLNLIQILWDCHWNKTLAEIKHDRKFIKQLNICVFDDIIVDSIGEHSDNNSRTQLVFRNHLYNECVDACVYGTIKKNTKNVGFVKESV
jgi:hypothetical protein|tara:strand:+ start:225 stop:884 length:660 start_codon:yes stop_codon:yes gene_type:complete